MIVVDSNILVYLFVQGTHTPAAETVLEQERTWAAPILWRSELRNALAGYLRSGALRMHEVRLIQSKAEELMRENEYQVDSSAVFDLVHCSDCSAYDCEYVALAMHLGTKLVTLDGRVLRAFPQVACALPLD